jgi:hypothetical protein
MNSGEPCTRVTLWTWEEKKMVKPPGEKRITRAVFTIALSLGLCSP